MSFGPTGSLGGMSKTTHVVQHAQADITYDVHGPLPTVGGRPPLMMIGQPMAASGFRALAALMPERTVVTYDPRGMDRSTRHDGRDDAHTPGPGGGRARGDRGGRRRAGGPVREQRRRGDRARARRRHPDDVRTLVAHEPPMIAVLPDADGRPPARATPCSDTYEAKGWGPGMAAFMALISWQGEFTDATSRSPPRTPRRSACRPRTTARATIRC